MSPRVSVVVSCFDLGSTLEEALASVEAQTLRDRFEDDEVDWKPTDSNFPALLDMNTVNGAAPVRRSVWRR